MINTVSRVRKNNLHRRNSEQKTRAATQCYLLHGRASLSREVSSFKALKCSLLLNPFMPKHAYPLAKLHRRLARHHRRPVTRLNYTTLVIFTALP